jgi:GNAT superfamily N-acetyltransferase
VTTTRAQPDGDERPPDRPGTPCGRHPLPWPAASARQPARIRPACAADRPALAEMLSRCTGLTRSLRFLAPLRSFPEPYLTEALSGHPEHYALVAATPAAVVALASCRAVSGDTAELAVLVEDARQRQGIGTRLLKRLIEHADRSGLRTLRATLFAEQEWIVRPLRAYGTCTAVMSKGVLEVTVRLRADDRNPDAGAQGKRDRQAADRRLHRPPPRMDAARWGAAPAAGPQ